MYLWDISQQNETEGEIMVYEEKLEGECPDANWLMGQSREGDIRWSRTGCKRRGCPVCGGKRKRKIAFRIGLGIRMLGRGEGAGWVVGTFAKDLEKPEAVKILGKFMRRVRKESGVKVEYAVTWELHKKGGLHVNILMIPWVYVPHKVLVKWWVRYGGRKRLSIKRVGAGIGVEAAKAKREARKYGNYVAKFDQMVREGRGVSYSKGWPKLPEQGPVLERKGEVTWTFRDKYSIEAMNFRYERSKGYWKEVGKGEFGFMSGEKSDSFEREAVSVTSESE